MYPTPLGVILALPSFKEKSGAFCMYSKARSCVLLDFLGRTNGCNFAPPGRSAARAHVQTPTAMTSAMIGRLRMGDMNGFLSA